MRGRDGLSPGDIGDPVADSIRAEQNRDAAPHPDEVQPPECDECGEKHPSVRPVDTGGKWPSEPQSQLQPPTLKCKDCREEDG